MASLDEALIKARKLVTHFHHHSSKHSEALEKQQKTLNLPKQKLKMDVETRWNSTYDMIVSILESKEAIAQVLIGDKVYRNYILSADEEILLEEVRDILKPWKELTVRLSTENNVTISLIAPILHKLHQVLQLKDYDSELAVQMKDAIKEDLKKRYQDKNAKCIINTASLLDPRFKLLSFLSPDKKEAAHKNLEAKVLQIEDQKVKIQSIKVEKLTGDCAPSLPTLSDGNEMISASAAAAVKTEVVSPTSSPNPKEKG